MTRRIYRSGRLAIAHGEKPKPRNPL